MSGEELFACGAAVQRQAYDDPNRVVYNHTRDMVLISDIVDKLVRYGSLSEKQLAFLGRLVDAIDNRKGIEAARKAEHDAAADCPSGRVEVEGVVLKTELKETTYGDTLKMLVKTDAGWLVWGTVPAALALFDVPKADGVTGEDWTEQRGLVRGDRVRFTAAVEQSEKDTKFGFFKRPTKAEMVELAKESERE